MQDFKNFKSSNPLDFFYPPILDEDPQFAARFLTKSDIKLCYEGLKAFYANINSNENFAILRDTAFTSAQNYRWLAAFFKELEDILEIEERVEVPFPELPEAEDTEFQTPFHKGTSNKVVREKITIGSDNIIDLYRYIYITKFHKVDEFIDGFPLWYNLNGKTLYEAYDERTNYRIRIDGVDNELRYYVSGASDNWQEIVGVPIEIDYVVEALLFRKQYSDNN